MTWYADEIILRASAKALAAVAEHPALAPFAYHIRSLANHVWHAPEHRHGVLQEGLLVIRPVRASISSASGWYEEPVLDWATLASEPSTERLLDREATEELAEHLGEELLPPLSFRSALALLSRRVDSPVIYYSCSMWGGDIDYEYSLIYESNQSLFAALSKRSPEAIVLKESLRTALLKIGLVLPTPYFAPHTRGFDWQAHKLV